MQLFINNEFVNAVSGKKFPTINPANETIIAQIAEGDKVCKNYLKKWTRYNYLSKVRWG